jgi:GT2 family glycosyltransferase
MMIGASKAPLDYRRWTRHGEVRAFAEFRRQHRPAGAATEVVVLLCDEEASRDASNATLQSIRAAFGDSVVYSLTGRSSGTVTMQAADGLADALSHLADQHRGAWLLAIRSGDRVSPALGDIVSRLTRTGAPLAYWDEDRIDGEERSEPWIKPGWDPLLFERLGGLAGASIVELSAAERFARSVRTMPMRHDSFQMLLLGMAKLKRPQHVPLVLTHRGAAPPASAIATPAPPSPRVWPSVSIIIATRDKPKLLAACLSGIERVDYPGRVQTVVVDNATRDPQALRLLEQLEQRPDAIVLRDAGKFNFARLNNLAAAVAEGEFLCLLNNDVEPLDDDWLKTLVSYAAEEGVGAVGAQLLYPDGRIQHAGVAIGLGGAAGHIQKGVDPSDRRFWTWHAVTREVSAVTAAVMVVNRKAFAEVGGFDDDAFAVAFNDVDLCLRLKGRGLRNLYVAEARLLHLESESRGSDRSPPQAKRLEAELKRLQERWGTEGYLDPHFSPLFSRLVERCVLSP